MHGLLIPMVYLRQMLTSKSNVVAVHGLYITNLQQKQTKNIRVEKCGLTM